MRRVKKFYQRKVVDFTLNELDFYFFPPPFPYLVQFDSILLAYPMNKTPKPQDNFATVRQQRY